MLFFNHHGFSSAEIHRRRVGPVVKNDHLEYFREVGLMTELRVTLACAGLAPDCSRFKFRNEIWRDDGQLAARVTSIGGWLDLDARKLVVPPADMRAAMEGMERTTDFETLPSSIK
jgi:acyl-CoA thioester hydrolase